MEKKSREGIPMSEESLKEWQQAFQDIEDSIKLVYKGGSHERSSKNNAKKS